MRIAQSQPTIMHAPAIELSDRPPLFDIQLRLKYVLNFLKYRQNVVYVFIVQIRSVMESPIMAGSAAEQNADVGCDLCEVYWKIENDRQENPEHCSISLLFWITTLFAVTHFFVFPFWELLLSSGFITFYVTPSIAFRWQKYVPESAIGLHPDLITAIG